MYFEETHLSIKVDDVLFLLSGQVTKFEETPLEVLKMGYKYDHTLLVFQL